MKKRTVVLFLLGILLVSPVVLAQEQSQTYSEFNRLTDNIKMFFSSGDNKVKLALEIREKEVDSAITNIQNQEEDKAIKNLKRAKEKLQTVQEKVSLETSKEIKTNVNEIKEKISREKNLPEEFDEYILEEEKTMLTAELTEKTYKYCSELAKEDFNLMLKEEKCNPKTAPESLRDDLEKLKDLQERMFVQLMLEIRSCIDDPGTCNCEVNVDAEQKAKCEKMVALALKCEYKDDEAACEELELMKPKQGDNFAESFVPDFLRNLFKKKDYMIEYDIEPSDCVPEECWNYNNKPECKKYDSFKETKEDWDEYGNFIGTKNKCGKKGSIPTMRESIPQCFDGDVFLEEKCGKITTIENEEGLINYIIEKDVDEILEEFENKSEQNTISVNETKRQRMLTNKIKEEIDVIEEQIKEKTVKTEISEMENGNNVVVDDGGDNVVDESPKTKDNEDVSPELNIIDDDVAPGPQGIIGHDED